MENERYESAIRLLALLAHPARLRILDILRRGEACVCHLQAALEVPQPYVSQQLRVLREAGLISQRREGLFIYYRLADERVAHLLAEVLGPATVEAPIPHCACPRCQETHLSQSFCLVEVN
ncbi:MAG: metalloregulator ArsR/SmtB family transcription factor [Anaerolineae bacterium]|nr:metalloregulator ArsR/SmtB family transcription factor [Anaerolineae bacterium]MCX8068777.1 metalloregulator ArsR/SmtB family transcription factor [Anaerolineae bacterium]MDW7992832.1 metalloregulator ArsR/SmtB family transcription factor [Anaerolineae bacterium]